MKRIAITIAALAISTAAFAEDLENWASVLNDPVAKSSSYSAPNTYDENHGSVLLDLGNSERPATRYIDRGIDANISIGDADSLFNADPESSF